ncbi:hypothetical protein E2C01_002128 [Portunus trituberculatus]|uniref:Uncharacterized protein n=1 Tax=Portunus trituberculatus TaxID=210409 RepID=A0A5B7CLB7_PORTR|nr:hypothetical protein [Portunus trituberculatus]
MLLEEDLCCRASGHQPPQGLAETGKCLVSSAGPHGQEAQCGVSQASVQLQIALTSRYRKVNMHAPLFFLPSVLHP